MSCPDTNRLIDLLRQTHRDAELREHLENCPACRAELQLIGDVRAAFNPEIQVPEYLIRRAMVGLVQPTVSSGSTDQMRHVVTTAALGTLTTALTLLAAGNVSGPASLLLFSVATGGVAAAYEARRLRAE